MQEHDLRFCQREFRVASRQLRVPSRCGRGNYSTWLSLDFRVPRLVDTQIGETFRQKVLRDAFLGIFGKIFLKYFLAYFRAFLGVKSKPSNASKGCSGSVQKLSFSTSGNPYWCSGISQSAYLRALANPYVYWVLWKIRVCDRDWPREITKKKTECFFVRALTFFTSIEQKFFTSSFTHVVCKNRSEMPDSELNTCNLCADPLN